MWDIREPLWLAVPCTREELWFPAPQFACVCFWTWLLSLSLTLVEFIYSCVCNRSIIWVVMLYSRVWLDHHLLFVFSVTNLFGSFPICGYDNTPCRVREVWPTRMCAVGFRSVGGAPLWSRRQHTGELLDASCRLFLLGGTLSVGSLTMWIVNTLRIWALPHVKHSLLRQLKAHLGPNQAIYFLCCPQATKATLQGKQAGVAPGRSWPQGHWSPGSVAGWAIPGDWSAFWFCSRPSLALRQHTVLCIFFYPQSCWWWLFFF